MCFTVNVNIVREEMERRFGVVLNDPDSYRPSYYYHAFELPEMPAICSEDRGRIKLFQWGLIPFWTGSFDQAEKIRFQTFNARAETITSKPSFKQGIRSKRCLIPAAGFYEWQHRNNKKIPFYVHLKQRDIFSFAGVYDNWVNKITGELFSTFSIITTTANPMMELIHNTKKRMPVILEEEKEDLWLDQNTPLDDLLNLLVPYPEDLMEAHSISPLISKRQVEKNIPELIEPFSYDQPGLF